MSFFALFFIVLCIGISIVPVCLLRRGAHKRAQDYFVASESTPPGVIQNSSIAYALRLAAFGPFFAFGANGDFWPAIINSVCFGLGLYLLYILRRPMLKFLDHALSRDRSITVHAFIAQQHGNDVRVRLLASALTLFALCGLVVGEAFGVAALLKQILTEHAGFVYLIVSGTLLSMVLYTIFAGNSGAMQSAQLQLGMLYFGFFGATVLLLYLNVSALVSMPPHGTFAVLFVAVCCAIIPYYRRSKYVDTSPLGKTNADTRESAAVRALRRFEKIFNASLSVIAVLVIVVVVFEFYSEGIPAVLRDSAAALQAGTRMPTMALIAFGLLPLFYPMVDITNWQRIAAFEKDRRASNVDPSRRSRSLRKIFTIYAVESPLMGLFVCMFGAIAVVATETSADVNAMQAFIQRLASQQDLVAAPVLSLLLVGAFAMALSTMSSLFSASLCTIRYDVLPVLWPELAPEKAQVAQQATATRRTVIAGGGLYLVMIGAFCVADPSLRVSFTSSAFLGLLFAFYCAQLAFAPLILGPMIAGPSGSLGTVSPRWALVILGAGAASGIGGVIIYLTTGTELWLWASVPACLASGLLFFIVARVWPRERARAA